MNTHVLHVVLLGGASGEGVPTEPTPGFTADGIWSIMHLGIGGVPISGALLEDDQEMMLGLYSGFDY